MDINTGDKSPRIRSPLFDNLPRFVKKNLSNAAATDVISRVVGERLNDRPNPKTCLSKKFSSRELILITFSGSENLYHVDVLPISHQKLARL